MHPKTLDSATIGWTTVEPAQAGRTRVLQPAYLLAKYVPVSARIVGGGTSSAVPPGAIGTYVPEGAILVSQVDETTSTGTSWPL